MIFVVFTLALVINSEPPPLWLIRGLKENSMSLQYISDSNGQTTGVFIPINDWNKLKDKFKGLEEDQIAIPEWQIQETQRRIELIQKGEIKTRTWDEAEKDIFRK